MLTSAQQADRTRLVELPAELRAALWVGDLDALDRLAPCQCCCDEHTFPCCLARHWGGCRGGLPYGDEGVDERAWAAHYATYHGLTDAQFWGAA